MAEYDLIVRNGTIVDGTGGIPAYRGDVAVKDGKIAMISGRIKATAMKEVDATGCIVAPGAIDLHNHYDLQLNWDPYATMSGWHGVTSVAIGQCGFGFAPCKPKDQEAAMRLQTRIEAIPLSTMEKGLPWDLGKLPSVNGQPGQAATRCQCRRVGPFQPAAALCDGHRRVARAGPRDRGRNPADAGARS